MAKRSVAVAGKRRPATRDLFTIDELIALQFLELHEQRAQGAEGGSSSNKERTSARILRYLASGGLFCFRRVAHEALPASTHTPCCCIASPIPLIRYLQPLSSIGVIFTSCDVWIEGCRRDLGEHAILSDECGAIDAQQAPWMVAAPHTHQRHAHSQRRSDTVSHLECFFSGLRHHQAPT